MQRNFSLILVSGAWLLGSSAHALIDADTDGMSDLWETLHSFSTTSNTDNPPDPDQAATADPDKDGWTNLQEAIAGTDPDDPNTPNGLVRPDISFTPGIFEEGDQSATTSGGAVDPFTPGPSQPAEPPPILIDPPVVTLTWSTLKGKTYHVEISENLANWTPASAVFMGEGIPLSFASENVYSDGTVAPKVFMRVVIGDNDSDGDGLTDHEEYQISDPNNPGTTLDPYNPDTDGDGISDGDEYLPGTDNSLAFTNLLSTDPDGFGLPAGLENGLLARWDLEQIKQASSQGDYYTLARYPDSLGTAPLGNFPIVPFHTQPKLDGMPSIGAGTTATPVGYLSPPRSLLHNRNTYSVSMWVRMEKNSLTASRPRASLFSHHRKIPTANPAYYTTDVHGTWIDRQANGTQILRAGSYTYTNTTNPYTETFDGLSSAPMPAGTFDDGKFHHYLLVRADGIFTLYRDGEIVGTDGSVLLTAINATNQIHTGISFGRFDGPPAEAGFPYQDPNATAATFDRLRMWSRALNATDATDLFQQDIDRDGLWDITESSTRLWRDNNSNATRDAGEINFQSNPFHAQPTAHDTDGDGLTDLYEQNVSHTEISNPDSDGDLIPDGWEVDNGLNPNDSSDAVLDLEPDGVNNLDEYRNNSDPNVSDTDGDGTSDEDEINGPDGNPDTDDGSNPNDPSDNGQQLPPAERLTINLGIGDESGSESEDYVMHIYRIDPETGAEIRFHTHRSGGFGQYKERPLSWFRKGETYTFQIDWQSTNNDTQTASGGTPAEGPDFDYTFKVEPQGTYLGKLIPSWDSQTGSLTHPSPLAANDASNVATTQQEFEENYESRRIAIVAPKLHWQAIEGFENLDTHIDPWSTTNEEKGKRIFPGRKNPNDNRIRHKLHLVAKGGLKGVQVFVKSFDIDDSTDEGFDVDTNGQNPVIDTNGHAGDDNLEDHYSTAKAGHFKMDAAWVDNTAVVKFGTDGRASFEFKTGFQPGNNYRAVASVGDEGGFSAVQVTNSAVATYLGPELSQTGQAIASGPLTVWRRLWVENDSMAAVNATGGANANFFPVTVQYAVADSLAGITDPGLVVVSEQVPNTALHYQNGFFRPTTGGEWRVFQTRLLPNESHIVTYGVPNGISGSAKLFDDDGRGLVAPQLPRHDLVNAQMKTYFLSSFIEVADATAYNPNKLLTFKPNEDAFPTDTILDDTRDLIDTPGLWVCTVVAAYQGVEEVDLDPDNGDENPLYGETSGFDGNDQFSVVYVETCREVYADGLYLNNPSIVEARRSQLAQFIVAVLSHEIGHHPGTQHPDADHGEGLLMSSGLEAINSLTFSNAYFTPKTVVRFRKSKRWAD